jgi:UPF0716 protein FxsA
MSGAGPNGPVGAHDRYRLSTMRFFGVFALIAVLEMATFFWVQSWIGLGWALGIALATALIGSYLVKRAGLSVLGRMRSKVDQGRLPGRELSDGAAVLVAGAFLISPGFITDTLGFLLLVPKVRDLVYRFVTKRFSSRVTTFTSNFTTVRQDPIIGEVIDVDPEDEF